MAGPPYWKRDERSQRQQIRHLRDIFNPSEKYEDEDLRLHFRLRKDSVCDLDKDLQHQTRRGLPLTPMQQVLIALRLYATGTFQRVIGDLFGISVFVACPFIHKVSGVIAKQFLSFPENLANTKRKFHDVAHFSGSLFQTNIMLWHLLTESSFTPSGKAQSDFAV